MHLDDEACRSIAHGANPRRTAIAVLAALDLSVPEISQLPKDAVTADGSTVRLDDREVSVPEAAQPLLVTQHLYRILSADPANPQFLAGTAKDAEVTNRVVSQTLNEVAATSGIAFRAKHDSWESTTSRWRQRTGLSVKRVAA